MFQPQLYGHHGSATRMMSSAEAMLLARTTAKRRIYLFIAIFPLPLSARPGRTKGSVSRHPRLGPDRWGSNMKNILASQRYREMNCAAVVDIEIRNRSGAKSDSYQIKPVCCSKITHRFFCTCDLKRWSQANRSVCPIKIIGLESKNHLETRIYTETWKSH